MKKSFKKGIAILLSVLMVAISLPSFTALAAAGEDHPDFTLQFGTFYDAGDSGTVNSFGWTDRSSVEKSATKKSDAQITCSDFSGMYGPPLTYTYTKNSDGSVSGTLKLEKSKTESAAAVLASFADGVNTFDSDYTYGVGDYFTVALNVKDVTRCAAIAATIGYSDNIEPVGLITNQQSSRKTIYKTGVASELAALNEKYPSYTATIDYSSSNLLTKNQNIEEYYTINAIQYNTPTDPTSGTAIGDQSVIDTTNRLIKWRLDGKNLDNNFDHAYTVNSTNSDYSDTLCFTNPETGELGYNYDSSILLNTYVFKIVGEGDITFSVNNWNSNEEDSYESNYFSANFRELNANKLTTYALNDTYNDVGVENAGSRNISFMGFNANRTSTTTSYDITFKFADDSTKVVSTEEGAMPTAPANTADKIVDNGDGTHSTTKYTWPTLAAASEATTYTEVATVGEATACTYGDYTTVTQPTINAAGSKTATCSVCGHVDTQEIPQLDGTAYTAAVSDATTKAASGNYTDTSVASLQSVLDTYTSSVVGAYNTQAEVDAATKAITDAVAALEAKVTMVTYTYKYADTTKADVTVEVAEGETPTAPTEHSAAVVTSDNAGKHTTTPYKWGDADSSNVISEVADTANAVTADCTLDYTVTKDATIAAAGSKTATCPTCNYVSTVAIDKLDGTAYYVALKAAQVVDSTKYTADSYKAVSDALSTYAQATVEAYTSADDVKTATDALTSAVAGLVEAYTITFTTAGGTSTTQTVAKGETPTAPANTADTAIASDDNGTSHSHTTYAWTEVVAATADATYTEVATKVTDNCTAGAAVVDKSAMTSTTSCTVCGQVLSKTDLEGVNVTVKSATLGDVTFTYDGASQDLNTAKKVVKNDTVTLTAKPADGAKFVGWAAGDKIVSKSTTYTPVAVGDVTYTAVFTADTTSTYTVIFVDPYGNVINTQEVATGSNPTAPTAPSYVGYTFTGWSVDPATVTAGCQITAKYTKDTATTYTVKADGATITANGQTATGELSDIPYDALVTVTKSSTAAWAIGDATVAYGDTYSFYVGSNVTLTAATGDAEAVVAKVSVTPVTGSYKVEFLATRYIPSGYTLVTAGFVYGKGIADENLTLENAPANSGKIAYTQSTANQFALSTGSKSKNGTLKARAFITVKDGSGNISTKYADIQSYTYGA